ncbi:MAG TPA: hypothetical protein VG406_23090 [Isosphaeraceae bacterium]|jgi:hypothetical protein|nr:hypothetical protein [Isosphaeraceae bacterium]
MRRSAATSLLVLLAIAPCWGCGRGQAAAAPVKTLPVKGTVRYNGKPVTQGTIKFEPEGPGREATGAIQPDGTFTLSTYEPDDGAVPGPHRVAITGAGATVPQKYSNFSSSGVEVEVAPDRSDYPIDLK